MQIHTFMLRPRTRAGAVALGVAVVAAGGLLLVLGLAMLVALATVGVVAGSAMLLYRRLTGRTRRPPVANRLDPRMEIPVRPAEERAEIRWLPPDQHR